MDQRNPQTIRIPYVQTQTEKRKDDKRKDDNRMRKRGQPPFLPLQEDPRFLDNSESSGQARG
ncbi:MAG: hypothetical protein A3H42_02205 [Deltaproteobacteria bacterium RIFCSPLOWO2_02_FULL_46_8]|nr:MAG: hypothetical protein A3H42_02205 [Deltaproteobacteria bacterium RIFCSPLOWO2_02_FULL_46_8]